MHVLKTSSSTTGLLVRSIDCVVLDKWSELVVPLRRSDVRWESAPLTIRSLLDLLKHLLTSLVLARDHAASTLAILIVNLHEIDSSQIVLHLLKVLAALTINHFEDVLHLVG